MSEEFDDENIAQLKDLMGAGYAGLVETYLSTGRAHVAGVQNGLETGDAVVIVDAAHPLKSSSGNMGLRALSQTATDLEKQARDCGGDVQALRALVERLAAEFERGEQFLKETV